MIFSTLARPEVKADVSWNPLDPRWYREVGGMRSDTGVVVVPEAALSVAVLYRAVNVLAHAVASVPLVVYGQTDDDGKEKARQHPAYNLLHDQPNRWTTSFRWRHLAVTQSIVWGAHYSQILPGPGGIGQLVPLNPDTTRIVDQMSDGRLVYVTRDSAGRGLGEERRLVQDEVFHLRGFSIDGKEGIPLPKLARNAIGLALTAERHGSMFLRQGARFPGYLSTDGTMAPEKRTENEEAWQRAYGGPRGSGRTPILTGGMKYETISANNRDSQWIESREFQAKDILRFTGVPGILVGFEDHKTFASASEMTQAFVKYGVQPITHNFAQELNASVITGSPEFFADFILEGLLRGDIQTRYEAHRVAVVSGWKTRNEVRVEENYNRGPAALDDFLEPSNMDAAGAESPDGADGRRGRSNASLPDPGPDPLAERLARQAAERLVRKEVLAVAGTEDRLGAAARFADSPDKWREWLADFYGRHVDAVAEDLCVSAHAAASYCAAQRTRLETLAAVDGEFEADSVAALLRLTFSEQEEAA